MLVNGLFAQRERRLWRRAQGIGDNLHQGSHANAVSSSKLLRVGTTISLCWSHKGKTVSVRALPNPKKVSMMETER
jgi:hypothetical protein